MTEHPTPYAEPAAPQPASTYAGWGDRAVATLWDFVYLWPALLTFLVGCALLLGALASSNDYEMTGAGNAVLVAGIGALLISQVWLLVRQIRNYVVRQGRTGQSWGKEKAGIWVVDERTGAAPGWGSCLGRWLLHGLINQAFYLDYLWPLWDAPKRQTLTDKILGTVVIKRA